jgi:hypothetical protein
VGLGLAAGFSLALNFALIVTFVWPAAVSLGGPDWVVPTVAWVSVLCFWVVALRSSAGQVTVARPIDPAAKVAAEQMLREAQQEYLKGHWIEAETLLNRLRLQTVDDLEAGLLTAMIYRRTARRVAARKLLETLAELPRAAYWQHEIATELTRLETSEEESPTARAA